MTFHVMHQDGSESTVALFLLGKNEFTATVMSTQDLWMSRKVLCDRERFSPIRLLWQLNDENSDFIVYTQQYCKMEHGAAIYYIRPDVPFQYIPLEVLYPVVREGFARMGMTREAYEPNVTALAEIHQARMTNMMRRRRPTYIVLNKAAMEEFVRTSGGQVIKAKGATFYAVAMSVCHLCKCCLNTAGTALTISTMMHGEYGVEDVCLSTLALVDRNGVRGKILNCLKADYDRIFKSDIITDLIRVLGCGVEVQTKKAKDLSSFDLANLRWNKVVICTDADVDGYQIRTLILTMLYRLTPTLIEKGYVFIAESHLYEINCKDDTYFAYTEEEKARITEKLGKAKYTVQRSKGLGENEPDMMWLTTMNPETRRLIKVTPSEAAATEQKFNMLLGDDLQGRKDHIATNGYLYLDDMDLS